MRTQEPLGSDIKSSIETKISKTKIQEHILIDWGNNYFVDEEAPKVSVNVFNDITQRGIPGLIITRTPSEKAKEQWGLNKCNIIWLCSRTGGGYLKPALEKIFHTIFEYIKENEYSVILLDGVEYIVNNNDFLKTLNLIDNLKEFVALNNSMLINSISSTIFSEKEFALLGKNSIEIQNNVSLDFSNIKID